MDSAEVSDAGSMLDQEALTAPFPSEENFPTELDGEHHSEEGEQHEEHEEGGVRAAPKVFRHYEIAYDREVDGPRKKKDLFWNIMQLSYRQAYAESAEARKAETSMRPGMRILGDIPARKWTMFHYDVEDPNSDLIFAYGLDLKLLDVQDVSVISHLRHLRFLDLSGNRMKMDSVRIVENFPKLLSLKVNENRLSDLNVPAPTLIELEIAQNRLMTVEPFNLPAIEHAVLSKNRLKKIQNFNDETTPCLTHFSCTHCRLKSTSADPYWPSKIKYLYLGYNKIRKIEGLEKLVNLRGLHLRGNRIKKLKGFDKRMSNLRYLNVRENKISNVKQFKKLRVLPRLKFLICKGNPFETERPADVNRLAIVYCLRKLFRINKDEVTVAEVRDCLTARDVVDNEEDSSDDDVQEDLEDYDDEYNDAPPAIWDEEDEEFTRYETATTVT